MHDNRNFKNVLICFAVILLVLFALKLNIQVDAKKPTEVFVANWNIKAGEPIINGFKTFYNYDKFGRRSERHVGSVQIIKTIINYSDDYITKVSQLKGKYAKVDILEGTILTKDEIK